MNTVFGLIQSANPKHDFSGDLGKEKKAYEMSILKFINDIKIINRTKLYLNMRT